jgi:hypothetical protein
MSGKTLYAVNVAFKHEFLDDVTPARITIYRLSKKSDETGSVDKSPQSDTPKSVTMEDNMRGVFFVVVHKHHNTVKMHPVSSQNNMLSFFSCK